MRQALRKPHPLVYLFLGLAVLVLALSVGQLVFLTVAGGLLGLSIYQGIPSPLQRRADSGEQEALARKQDALAKARQSLPDTTLDVLGALLVIGPWRNRFRVDQLVRDLNRTVFEIIDVLGELLICRLVVQLDDSAEETATQHFYALSEGMPVQHFYALVPEASTWLTGELQRRELRNGQATTSLGPRSRTSALAG